MTRNEDICRAYGNGDPIAVIAAAHGITPARVRQIARAGGRTIRPTGRPRKYV